MSLPLPTDISTLMTVVNFPVGERGFIPKLAAKTLPAPSGRWGVRHPERRRERDVLPRGHPGYHRDVACPGWMRRGCFRGADRRDEVHLDEAHPA